MACGGKDAGGPRGASASHPASGVEGQVPGDLEPFSNLGKGDRGQGTKDQGPGAQEATRPVSSARGTGTGSSLVSGPTEGRPKRACKQPVRLAVGSKPKPQSKRTVRG